MKHYTIEVPTLITIIEIGVGYNEYKLAASGKKSNIHEFLTMDEHIKILNDEPEYITIYDSNDPDKSFKRKITDIAYLCDSRITDKKSYVFSWG